MNWDRYIELAREYVRLSNAHELERIFPMFAEDAVYISKIVGSFEGREAIEAMMRGFFAKIPDVRWEVAEYALSGDREVSFDFVRHFSDPETGGPAQVQGHEVIVFSEAGLIERIEVG
jgi:uncharacterized protein (TIGR02246 family)